MKNGFIYGLLAGILYMAWVILFNGIFPNLIFGPLPSIGISSLIAIIFMIIACQREKAKLDGSIRFGEAFMVCLTTYAVFGLVYTLGFKFYLENSPTVMALFLETSKKSTENFLTMIGTPEDQIFEAKEALDIAFEEAFTWSVTLINYVTSIIFPGALIALFIAGISSKFSKKPSLT